MCVCVCLKRLKQTCPKRVLETNSSVSVVFSRSHCQILVSYKHLSKECTLVHTDNKKKPSCSSSTHTLISGHTLIIWGRERERECEIMLIYWFMGLLGVVVWVVPLHFEYVCVQCLAQCFPVYSGSMFAAAFGHINSGTQNQEQLDRQHWFFCGFVVPFHSATSHGPRNAGFPCQPGGNFRLTSNQDEWQVFGAGKWQTGDGATCNV